MSSFLWVIYCRQTRDLSRPHGKVCSYLLGSSGLLFSQTVQSVAYMKQKVTGTSWDEMLDSFKQMVSRLYREWQGYLWDSLDSKDQKDFQSIRGKTASHGQWRISLEQLSEYLAKKSGRKVIVLIDEYEAPNNRAHEFNFFMQACHFMSFPVTFKVDNDPG